jgi:hypothetical protein
MRRHETVSCNKWDDATYKNGESGVHCQRTDNDISKWIGSQLQKWLEEGRRVRNLDRRRLWTVARRLLSNILDNSKQYWTFLNLEKDKEEFVFGTLVAYLHAVSLLGLFLHPEHGSDMFFRNIRWLATYYTELQSQKTEPAKSLFCFFFYPTLEE